MFSGHIIMALGSLLPLLLTCSSVHMVMLLLVGLGQAHFVHCYIYQYRAKKMDIDFWFKLLLGLALSAIACVYLGDHVMIPAILIFILHQFFDDLYLHQKQAGVGDYTQLVLVLLACFFLSVFGLQAWGRQLAVALVGVAILVGLFAKQRHTLITLSLPFGLPLLYVSQNYHAKDWLIPAGIIIVSHYLRWLIYIYQTRAQAQKWAFLTEALMLNSIGLLYAVATVFGGHSEHLNLLLQGLFSTQAFVIWTMGHIASTVRPRLFGAAKA
jgi:hypothetical protein